MEAGCLDSSYIGLVMIQKNHIPAYRPIYGTAGDSRAVMGLKKTDGKYQALALSEDHNAKLPKEMALLSKAHPGEKDIVKCKHPNACYVKGRLQPTRYVVIYVYSKEG